MLGRQLELALLQVDAPDVSTLVNNLDKCQSIILAAWLHYGLLCLSVISWTFASELLSNEPFMNLLLEVEKQLL